MINILFLHTHAFSYQTQALIDAINMTQKMQASLCTSWSSDSLDKVISSDTHILITIHSRKSILKNIYDYCRQKKIVLILLQDGIIDYKHWNVVATDRYDPQIGDYFFVFGKASEELLLKRGVAQEKIIITGCARFDTYFSSETIKGDYVLITCANTPYHSLKEKVTLFIQFMRLICFCKINHYTFYIRLPESVKKKLAFRFLLLLQKNNSHKKISLLEEISGAQLVCTTMSTIVLESLCLGKPVLLIKNHTYPLYIHLPLQLTSIFSKIPFKNLNQVVFSEEERIVLEENIAYQGHSMQRIIDKLEYIKNKHSF